MELPMVGLRVYSPNSVMQKYVASWGIDDSFLPDGGLAGAIDETTTIQEIISIMDNFIFATISGLFSQDRLSKEQMIAFFKMLYLKDKMYESINIFKANEADMLIVREWFIKASTRYDMPNTVLSEMKPQEIDSLSPARAIKNKILQRLEKINARFRTKL